MLNNTRVESLLRLLISEHTAWTCTHTKVVWSLTMWYIGTYTHCTPITCKYRAATVRLHSVSVRVCVRARVCVLYCLPFIRRRVSASLLLHVRSRFSRPKPHVIYPATSPTNYSLHTAAENHQPHTVHFTHTLTETHTKEGQWVRKDGGKVKKGKTLNVKILSNTGQYVLQTYVRIRSVFVERGIFVTGVSIILAEAQLNNWNTSLMRCSSTAT